MAHFKRFTQLPLELVERSNLGGCAVILYSLMYDQHLNYTSKGQNYIPTVEYLSHKLGFSNTAIKGYLKILKEAGLVIQTAKGAKGRTANTYIVRNYEDMPELLVKQIYQDYFKEKHEQLVDHEPEVAPVVAEDDEPEAPPLRTVHKPIEAPTVAPKPLPPVSMPKQASTSPVSVQSVLEGITTEQALTYLKGRGINSPSCEVVAATVRCYGFTLSPEEFNKHYQEGLNK